MYLKIITFTLFGLLCGFKQLSALTMAPVLPLKERIEKADTVFQGKLVNKRLEGLWVYAEIVVNKPLWNAREGERISVIWRKYLLEDEARVSSQRSGLIYDVQEGAEGIAILDSVYKGRYMLRSDKFESVGALPDIERHLVSVSPIDAKVCAERTCSALLANDRGILKHEIDTFLINLRTLGSDERVVALVRWLVALHCVNSAKLTFEVNETEFIDASILVDIETTGSQLQKIHFGLSIDEDDRAVWLKEFYP